MKWKNYKINPCFKKTGLFLPVFSGFTTLKQKPSTSNMVVMSSKWHSNNYISLMPNLCAPNIAFVTLLDCAKKRTQNHKSKNYTSKTAPTASVSNSIAATAKWLYLIHNLGIKVELILNSNFQLSTFNFQLKYYGTSNTNASHWG